MEDRLLGWREVEDGFRFGRVRWNVERARLFNRWAADRLRVNVVRVEEHDRTIGYGNRGVHYYNHKIVIGTGSPGYHIARHDCRELWAITIHEITHYLDRTHRRSFTRNLRRVYELWWEYATTTTYGRVWLRQKGAILESVRS